MQRDISSSSTSSSSKVRVLHSLAALRSGGVDLLLCNYYKYMDHSKIAFDFIVHVPDKGMAETFLEKEGAHVFHLPRFRKLIGNFFRFRKIVKEGHYDIVHAHHTAKSFMQLLAAWSCGVKIRIAHSHDCLVEHGFTKLRFKFYSWLTTRCATDYFACGEWAGRYVFGKGVDSPRFHLLPNAISVSRFAFNPETREKVRSLHRLENCFVLLHVGRFTDQKNHKRLIGIFARILKKRPDARLVLIGEGELEADARKQVQGMGLESKVLFIGPTPDIPSFLSAADVFVLPSLHEGLGIVLIEAQASGLPCVASKTFVPPEADVSGGVRFVPLEASDEQWAQTICNCQLGDRSLGVETVRRAGYDLAHQAKKLEEWYLSRVSALTANKKEAKSGE